MLSHVVTGCHMLSVLCNLFGDVTVPITSISEENRLGVLAE